MLTVATRLAKPQSCQDLLDRWDLSVRHHKHCPQHLWSRPNRHIDDFVGVLKLWRCLMHSLSGVNWFPHHYGDIRHSVNGKDVMVQQRSGRRCEYACLVQLERAPVWSRIVSHVAVRTAVLNCRKRTRNRRLHHDSNIASSESS